MVTEEPYLSINHLANVWLNKQRLNECVYIWCSRIGDYDSMTRSIQRPVYGHWCTCYWRLANSAMFLWSRSTKDMWLHFVYECLWVLVWKHVTVHVHLSSQMMKNFYTRTLRDTSLKKNIAFQSSCAHQRIYEKVNPQLDTTNFVLFISPHCRLSMDKVTLRFTILLKKQIVLLDIVSYGLEFARQGITLRRNLLFTKINLATFMS